MLKKCWYCASKSCCLEIPVRLQKCFAALFLNRFHAMRSPCTFKSKPIAENINSFGEIIILEKLLETRLVFRPTWLYFLYVYQVKEVPLKLLRISVRLLLELRFEIKIITESVEIITKIITILWMCIGCESSTRFTLFSQVLNWRIWTIIKFSNAFSQSHHQSKIT